MSVVVKRFMQPWKGKRHKKLTANYSKSYLS